jgi:LemA protein
MGLWIGLGAGLLLAVVVMAAVVIYNGLVRARVAVGAAFSQIDVQLTRRHDLIPNLVETAKGYLAHERQTLEAVTNARNAAVAAQSGTGVDTASLAALAGAENQLTAALGRLFALAEAYPDLKANQNMLALQEELTTTENRIAFARQAYNDAVMVYNTKREVLPSSIIASMFSFHAAELFEIDDPQERATPQVSF